MEIIKIHKYEYNNWHKWEGGKVLNRDKTANRIYLKYHIPKGIKWDLEICMFGCLECKVLHLKVHK